MIIMINTPQEPPGDKQDYNDKLGVVWCTSAMPAHMIAAHIWHISWSCPSHWCVTDAETMCTQLTHQCDTHYDGACHRMTIAGTPLMICIWDTMSCVYNVPVTCHIGSSHTNYDIVADIHTSIMPATYSSNVVNCSQLRHDIHLQMSPSADSRQNRTAKNCKLQNLIIVIISD